MNGNVYCAACQVFGDRVGVVEADFGHMAAHSQAKVNAKKANPDKPDHQTSAHFHDAPTARKPTATGNSTNPNQASSNGEPNTAKPSW